MPVGWGVVNGTLAVSEPSSTQRCRMTDKLNHFYRGIKSGTFQVSPAGRPSAGDSLPIGCVASRLVAGRLPLSPRADLLLNKNSLINIYTWGLLLPQPGVRHVHISHGVAPEHPRPPHPARP